MKTISLFIIIVASMLVVGCGGGSDASSSDAPVTRENTPQPNVTNDTLRPPKPPSI